jgi:hypothetical protein
MAAVMSERPAAGSAPVDATVVQDEGARQRAQARSEQPPTPQVPGYIVEARLGAGSFGEVWRATDINTGRKVAIKFFTRSTGLDFALLKQEVAKLLEMVNERRVVQLLRVGWEAEPPYYVMEYLPGGSLADRLGGHPLAIEDAVATFRGVAEALDYLHGKAILHCDLKPGNVLLDERHEVRLADFGQARRASETGPSLGTLFYMAPEQGDADARPDVRADIYALGALAFAMLTGRAPYATATASEHLASSGTTAERVQRYRKLIDESPAPRDHRRASGIDRAFADIVDRCLEKDPARRFESVPRVLAALDARQRQRARRPLVLLGIIGPIAVALLLGGVGLWARNRAVGDATTAVTAQTLENVAGYSTLVATVVDRNLSASRRQVERAAESGDVIRLLGAAEAGDRNAGPALQRLAESLFDEYRERSIHNWVLADRNAVILARAPFDANVVGRRYTYREWFTGRPDVAAASAPAEATPRTETGITRAFRSTAAGQPLVVSVAAPVWSPPTTTEPRRLVGVISATLHLATFNQWLADAEGSPDASGCPARFAALLNHGQLLRHPCPTPTAAPLPIDPAGYLEQTEVARLQAAHLASDFRDPLRDGQAYVAAITPLADNPEWAAIVQVDQARAMAPVTSLGRTFALIGSLAGAAGLATMIGLWLLLYRLTRESTASGDVAPVSPT